MILYKTGDATKPEELNSVLVHCCNNIGGWGSGFVLAIDKTFGNTPRLTYRSGTRRLGMFSAAYVRDADSNADWVINIIGQNGVISNVNPHPLQYAALREGLARLDTALQFAPGFRRYREAPIVMPRIGAGLAGGSWQRVAGIIEHTLYNRKVYVYDLPDAVEGKDWNP